MKRLLAALKDLLTARQFHRSIRTLALPMALAAILSSSLQIVDTLMIARLGDDAVAAVGLANRLTYVLSFFTSGLASGAGIFTAQFWGRRDTDGVKRTFTLSMLLALPIAAAFCAVACLYPEEVMRVFSKEATVIETGCDYLRLIGAAYLFQAATAVLSALLKSTERPRLPLLAGAAGILLNILLNWLLIFGKLGLPAMGARGAAIATLISAGAETALLAVLSRAKNAQVSLNRRSILAPGAAFTRQYLKTTIPVLCNDVGWALGVVATTWVYSTMGTSAAAAASVYETIKAFIVVCCVAIGSAGGVLVGMELGAGRVEAAEKNASRMLTLGVVAAVALCPVLLLLIDPLMTLYADMSAEAISSLRVMLQVLSILFWIKMCNYNLINGVLRAGGDTRAAALIDVGCMWAVAVPLVFVSGYVLKWPLIYVFPLTFIEDAAVALLAYRRYRQGVWKRRLV